MANQEEYVLNLSALPDDIIRMIVRVDNTPFPLGSTAQLRLASISPRWNAHVVHFNRSKILPLNKSIWDAEIPIEFTLRNQQLYWIDLDKTRTRRIPPKTSVRISGPLHVTENANNATLVSAQRRNWQIAKLEMLNCTFNAENVDTIRNYLVGVNVRHIVIANIQFTDENGSLLLEFVRLHAVQEAVIFSHDSNNSALRDFISDAMMYLSSLEITEISQQLRTSGELEECVRELNATGKFSAAFCPDYSWRYSGNDSKWSRSKITVNSKF